MLYTLTLYALVVDLPIAQSSSAQDFVVTATSRLERRRAATEVGGNHIACSIRIPRVAES